MYSGKILKQIEVAFSDLGVLEGNYLNFQVFNDLLNYMGYISESIN